MKEWLKEHALEVATLIVTITGVKWIVDLWSRLCEMSRAYTSELLLSCGLAAAVAVIATLFVSRNRMRKQLAAKDEGITELTKTFDERVSTEVKKQIVESINEFDEHLRIMNDPDSVIRDRIDARELDGHSTYILKLVLKTRVDERRWLREALSDGIVTVRDDELQMFDEGGYFRDLVEEEARCTDSYGKPARRYRIKSDVADVLSSNPEVFRIVEQREEEWREIARDHNERVARGRMKGHS